MTASWPASAPAWARFLAGLALVYLLFDVSANALGSDRGQAGLVVAGLVVSATYFVSRWLVGDSSWDAVGSLGLGRPDPRGVWAALVVCLLLVLVVPAYAVVTGTPFTMYPGWLTLVPGLFAQAGIAEETLFRGYLYGRLRRQRTFLRAAVVASGPFVLVHLILFTRLPVPVAVASVALAAAISFPLARLYDMGGRTVWAPALVHAVVQGAVKVVVLQESTVTFALLWMAASASLPFLVFAFVAPPGGEERR